MIVPQGANIEGDRFVVEPKVLVASKFKYTFLEVFFLQVEKVGDITAVLIQFTFGIQVVEGKKHELVVLGEPLVRKYAVLQVLWKVQCWFNIKLSIAFHNQSLSMVSFH